MPQTLTGPGAFHPPSPDVSTTLPRNAAQQALQTIQGKRQSPPPINLPLPTVPANRGFRPRFLVPLWTAHDSFTPALRLSPHQAGA